MKATSDWLDSFGAQFSAGTEHSTWTHLRNYSVEHRQWGEGQPLVLIPGLAGGFRLLGPLARALAHHFRVITYQLRGEDECFALRRRFGFTDLVEDLREFLDSQYLESPLLLGVSFGGVLAVEFAARHPHRIGRLIVQGVGARFEPGLLQQVATLVLGRYPLPDDSPFVNQFFNLFFGGRQDSGALVRFVTRQCWQTDQSVMAHRFHLLQELDLSTHLDRVKVPTLAMAGDRDMLVSERSLRDLCTGLPQSRFVRLKGCGHLAFVTRPERVSEEVCRFTQLDASCLV